jgi:hypothetical protein
MRLREQKYVSPALHLESAARVRCNNFPIRIASNYQMREIRRQDG